MAEAAGQLGADRLTETPLLRTVRLDMLASSGRFQALDKYEAYYRCTQYKGRKYDWDGRYLGYGHAADISPGWYVPIKHRQPSATLDLAKLIVNRFTGLLFGRDRFPSVKIPGDAEAEDFVKALIEACSLPTKIKEARDYGGSEGSACMSFGFIEGKPRVTVHNPKHCTVLRWVDRYDQVIGAVLESYVYTRRMFTEDGRMKEVPFYYVRYWDEDVEILWDPITADQAKDPRLWTQVKHQEVRHGYEFCPVYWCQNLPNSGEIDGESDYEGQCDNMDEINAVVSQTSRGTIANLDPTLVIKEDPKKNTGAVKKGSGQAIWASGGAAYLVLGSDAVKAGVDLKSSMKQDVLETLGVVLADPEKISGSAQSAQAIRILYMPMLTTADILRGQYGTNLFVRLLLGMLQASKKIMGQAPGPVLATSDGRRVQHQPTVTLAKRIEYEDVEEETDELDDAGAPVMEKRRVSRAVERTPGESEEILLVWPQYFPNTWADTKLGTEALRMASGNKPVISHRTAITAAAPMFGVTDIDQELKDIQDDTERSAAMFPGPDEMFPGGGGGEPGAPGEE